jgi:hypothetical protein
MDTKACSLTENEIKILIGHHGCYLSTDSQEERIERINYLNKRLKSFKEEAPKPEDQPKPITTQAEAQEAASKGW